MAVVFIGTFHLEVGEKLLWEEAEDILTECRVVWKKELETLVHFIGLEF